MATIFDKFLPNKRNRKMVPLAVCVLLAAVGTVASFVAKGFDLPILINVGMLVAAIGVVGGIFLIWFPRNEP